MKHTFHWQSRTSLPLFSAVNHHWRLMLLGQRVLLLFLIASWRNVCYYFSGNWKGLMISCATASWSLDCLLMPSCILVFFFSSLEYGGFYQWTDLLLHPSTHAMLQQEHGSLVPTTQLFRHYKVWGLSSKWSAFWIWDLFTLLRYSDLNYYFQTLLHRKGVSCQQLVHKEN